MPQLTPAELWELSPIEFNKWRRENDLKSLFHCFENGLPHFKEWLSANQLTIDFILNTDKPGQFFYWDNDVYCVKSVKDEFTRYSFYQVYDKKQELDLVESIKKPEKGEVIKFQKFTPYFKWIRTVKKISKPIKTKYSGDFDSFYYASGSAAESPEYCQWTITPGFTVLKLGATRIESWLSLLGRNLDFTNLDFLEIEEGGSTGTANEIFYSHCANIKLNRVEANFTEFYECEFMKLAVYNSRLYGITFIKCNVFQSYFENTSIVSLFFWHSPVSGLTFRNVETDGITYIPPKQHWYESLGMTYERISKNFKQLRVLYQSNGMRQESSESYYAERFYEMKSQWANSRFFKSISYIRKYRLKYGWGDLGKSIGYLIKFIVDFLSYSLWGFGERPLRIIGTSLILILIFSWIYVTSPIDGASGNYVNSFYFSIVTFTTLGFGDISPLKCGGTMYKLIVALEALFGAFCMGLIVAGFANKSRY